jgi:peptidoglycan lytic transglycosylase
MDLVRLTLHSLLALVFLSLAACSLQTTEPPGAPDTSNMARIPEPRPEPHLRPFQVGLASWYGPGFHGKVTASGKAFDAHDHTAAHRTLPMGTRVRVTNLSNGKSTEVTIIDRGPFARDRIIDLSSAAAEELGMKGKGTVRVRVEIIEKPEEASSEIDQDFRFASFG